LILRRNARLYRATLKTRVLKSGPFWAVPDRRTDRHRAPPPFRRALRARAHGAQRGIVFRGARFPGLAANEVSAPPEALTSFAANPWENRINPKSWHPAPRSLA
jgi:hypothetical protein